MPWKPTNNPHRGITFLPPEGHLASPPKKSRRSRKSLGMLQTGYTMGYNSKNKNTKSQEYCTWSHNAKCSLHLYRWYFRHRFLSCFWTPIYNYSATKFYRIWCETLLFRKLRFSQNCSSVAGSLAKWISMAENFQDLCQVWKFLSWQGSQNIFTSKSLRFLNQWKLAALENSMKQCSS